MTKAFDKMMGAPSTLLMNPGNWPWDRTGQGLDGSVVKAQRIHNAIAAGCLDTMRIVADKYCPLTVRRQFRFPRSKKKRIRKKWAKDRRNWRDENVAFLINMPKVQHDDRVDAAMLYNFQTKNVLGSK